MFDLAFFLKLHASTTVPYSFIVQQRKNNQIRLLCSSLLPRTALAAMLRGNIDEGWLTHFGLKCSSNTAVNAGTSSRSVCSSIGNTDFQSVRDSNCLGSRTFECITNINMFDLILRTVMWTVYIILAFTNHQNFQRVSSTAQGRFF